MMARYGDCCLGKLLIKCDPFFIHRILHLSIARLQVDVCGVKTVFFSLDTL